MKGKSKEEGDAEGERVKKKVPHVERKSDKSSSKKGGKGKPLKKTGGV